MSHSGCRVLMAIAMILLPLSQVARAESLLVFDGIDDRVMIPYHVSFPTEVFTVSAWIRTLPPTRRAAIVARGEDNTSFNLVWQIYVNPDGTLEIMLEDVNENNHCYPSTCMGQPRQECTSGDLFVADDSWHHVAATRNSAGRLVLYVDGEERAICQPTGVPSSNNSQFLTIGCTHGTIGPPPGGVEPPIWFFPGKIDKPAMWNIAMTGSQVQDVYRFGVDTASTGLVGLWDFEEGAGQDVADLSPAGNNGFLGANNAVSGDSADPQWETAISPGRVPDGKDVAGILLQVARNDADPTDLDLSWGASCSSQANDCSVHEGIIGAYYGHTVQMCSTGGALQVTLTPGGESTYYLVVPLNDDAEGGYGVDSLGNSRPASPGGCRPALVADPCP